MMDCPTCNSALPEGVEKCPACGTVPGDPNATVRGMPPVFSGGAADPLATGDGEAPDRLGPPARDPLDTGDDTDDELQATVLVKGALIAQRL